MILSLMAGILMTSINCSLWIGSGDNKQFGFSHIIWWYGSDIQLVVNDDKMFLLTY